MEPVLVHLRVLGGNPVHGSDALGFTDGDCPWNLSLGQRTFDGKFDGETFLGSLWMFFFGGRVGKRKRQTTFIRVGFHWTTCAFKRSHLCYILYVEQWGFHCNIPSGTTRRPVPHIEDSEGASAPRSVTDSTDQWLWCFIHMWFMLHVISVICLV
jgi:hypothetical protein